jgi:hypothetical protein
MQHLCMADFQTQLELTSQLEEGRLSSVESDTVELQRWIVKEVESSVNVLPEHSPPAYAPGTDEIRDINQDNRSPIGTRIG